MVKFLRNKALRVDMFGVGGPLEGGVVRGGEKVTVSGVVQNTGIGHSLVPEQRDFYECWVHFEARDERGKLIYESGGVGGGSPAERGGLPVYQPDPLGEWGAAEPA